MSRISPLTLLLSTLCVLFLASCATPRMPEVRKVSHFKVNRQNEDRKLQFAMDLDVYNPNRYKVKILEYQFDVFVNGQKVGNAFSDEKMVLKKQEKGSLPISIFTDFGKIAKGVLGLLKTFIGGDQKVDIALDGYIRAKARGIRKRIEVHKKEPFSINL